MSRIGALVAGLLLVGCGWATLVHDTVLGPVSPAGRIHDVTVGSGFHVTETGPVAQAAGEPLLRPYPADLIERIGAPHSLYSLAKGLEAFVSGFSPVTSRESRAGRMPPSEARAGLAPGLDVQEVLRRLGPPALWVRRRSGSLMLYRAHERSAFSFYLGVPPLAGALIPVPGVGSLRFRYTTLDERAPGVLLFFDDGDALESVAASGEPGSETQ